MFAEDVYGPLCAVAMACSKDETRPHLNSVLFEITKDRVRIVATDGHMLALCDVDANNGPCGTFLIPIATVKAALQVMKAGGKKGRARMGVNIADRVITAGGVLMQYTPTCDTSKFPPYVEVLPKGEPSAIPQLGIKGALIGRVGEMFTAVGKEFFAMQFRGDLDPVDCTNRECALRVVLMPARVEAADRETTEEKAKKAS